MRLVPDQDPDDILKRYTDFVKKLTPKGIETKIKVHSKGPACVVGTDNPTSRLLPRRCMTPLRKTLCSFGAADRFPIVNDFYQAFKDSQRDDGLRAA